MGEEMTAKSMLEIVPLQLHFPSGDVHLMCTVEIHAEHFHRGQAEQYNYISRTLSTGDRGNFEGSSLSVGRTWVSVFISVCVFNNSAKTHHETTGKVLEIRNGIHVIRVCCSLSGNRLSLELLISTTGHWLHLWSPDHHLLPVTVQGQADSCCAV